MLCYEIFSLCVLWVSCLIGFTYSVINDPAVHTVQHEAPNRRFYFYNPEILPHAAAALGITIPPMYYKPLPPLQYADYGEEEEEEIEEHEEKHPPNLQLLTFIKPKKSKVKKIRKKKKGRKGYKKIKKLAKKCMPFKFRLIRKSDMNSNDPFYRSVREHLPYGYRDEYFPQHTEKQDLAVISLNTSALSGNGTRFPQVLHFLYPSYVRRTRPKTRSSPPKTYRFRRPLPKRPQKIKSRRPWPRVNPWRLATPGKPISEFPLREPSPEAFGGSPPSSPIFNFYKDNRIPVSQAYLEEGKVEEQKIEVQTEEPPVYNRVTPNFVHFNSPTPNQAPVQYYQEQYWNKPETTERTEIKISSEYEGKYSDANYYQYSTYNNQKHPHTDGQEEKLNVRDNQGSFNVEQEPQANTNYNNFGDYYTYSNFATTSEKVITVTPTTSWVPVPQPYKVPHTNNEQNSESTDEFKSYSDSDNKQWHYMSGGFKNLSAISENNNSSVTFGGKISMTQQNCSSYLRNTIEDSNGRTLRKCLDQSGSKQETKGKTRKRIVNRKGNFKFYNQKKFKDEGVDLETSTSKSSFQNVLKDENQNIMKNKSFYIEEVTAEPKRRSTYYRSSVYSSEGRSYDRKTNSETEVVTSKYPQDDLSSIFISPNNSSSFRASRSHGGLRAVVSGSILVTEN